MASSRSARRGGPIAAAAACIALLCIDAAPINVAGDDSAGRGTLAAMSDAARATRCALRVTGLDPAGLPVLQSVAFSLDRPGLLVVPLGPLRAAAARWSMLRAAPDSGRPGADPGVVDITGLIELREDLGLAVLSAPGLPACPAVPADDAAAGTGSMAGGPMNAGPAGSGPAGPLIGIRERIGYRPRVFRAEIERLIRLPDGRDLLVTRVPDGGGAESGFLLDGRLRLAGVFLSPPVAADARLACVLPMTTPELSGSGGEERPALPLAALRPDGRPVTGDDPIGRFAASLVLSRVDQVDRAIEMIQTAARGLGEFGGLLVERGTLQYRAGRTAAAIDDFARASHLEPGLHVAHYNLGIALGSVDRYDEAAAALEQAARLAPEHARTIFHLALAYLAAGQSDGIRRQYESLAVIDPGLAVELKSLLDLP